MTVSVPSNFTYSTPSGGVLFWSNIAKTIRIAARRGNPYLPISSGSLMPNSSVLINYYMGTGIIVGIILIALLFTTITCLFECCCLLCCRKSIRAKQQRRRPRGCSTACSWFWYILCTVAIFLGAVFSFLGSSYLSNTITLASSGTIGTLNNTDNLLLDLTPAVNDAFSLMFTLINTTASQALNVVNTSLLVSTGVTPSLTTLANNISATDTSIQTLLSQGDAIASLKTQIAAILSYIGTNITTTQSAYTLWTTTFVPLSTGTYKYTPTSAIFNGVWSGASGFCSGASTNIANSPDGQSTLNPLRNLGLAAYATQINNIVSSLPSTIVNLVSNGTSAFTNNAVSTLSSTQQSISNSLSPTVTSSNNTFTSIINQASTVFNMVSSYDGYRKLAMTVLSAILILIVFAVAMGLLAKRPKLAKGCNFISCPVYFLVQFLALFLVILTFVLGDICSLIFDYSPAPISQGLDNSTQTMINNVFSFRQQCLQNVSLIQIAVNLGYLDGSSVNLTSKATDAINGLDFSTIATSWNVSSAISLSNNPTSQLANLTSLNLNSLNTTSVTSLQTSLTQLKTAVAGIVTALQGLITDVNVNAGTLTITGGLSVASVRTDLVSRINTEITRLQAISNSGGQVDIATALATYMSGNITALNSSTASLQTNAAAIPGSYAQAAVSLNYFSTNVSANLNAFIPTVKNNVIGTVSTVQTNFYAALNCEKIAESVNQIQDSMCGALLSGLDAVWFSYYVVGVFAFISIPSFIYFANVMNANRLKTAPRYNDIEADAGQSSKAGKQAANGKNIKKINPEPKIVASAKL